MVAEVGPHTVSFSFVDTLAPQVRRLEDSGDAAILAVDMPIGLSADGHRSADQLARDRLGPRRSTFFPTPIRSLLDFDDYDEANAHTKATIGKGLSKQTWNLMPKIREVDELWVPDLAGRLVEAHPETSFAEIAGGPVMSKKSTPEGRTERRALLRSQFGQALDTALDQMKSSLQIDAIDAAAAAWTARRVLEGTAVVLGGELDPVGRPMQLTI